MPKDEGKIVPLVDLATCELPPVQTLAQFRAWAEALATPFTSRFKAVFMDELDLPAQELEWLIDGILSVGAKSVIGGPSQSGKSFLAVHMGMCIAFDRPFFGMEVKPGLVIYQAGEGALGIRKRLRAWRRHFGAPFGRETPFVLLQGRVDLYSKEGDLKALIAEIRAIMLHFPELPLRMVVIDTLATAAIGAEENSARDIGIVMDNIQALNTALGAHVMLVHHMNAGGDRLRGSTAIYANIDQTVFVTRDPETRIRTAKLGKQRDDETDLTWQFELPRIVLGTTDRGREITSCVCVPVGERDALRRAEEKKGFVPRAEEAMFLRVLFSVERAYGRPIPPEFALPPANARSIVPWDEVKREFHKMLPDDEIVVVPRDDETEAEAVKRREERDKKRRQRAAKAIGRLRTRLTEFGVIGTGGYQEAGRAEPDGFCWWTGRAVRGFPETQPQEAEAERPYYLRDGDEADDAIPF